MYPRNRNESRNLFLPHFSLNSITLLVIELIMMKKEMIRVDLIKIKHFFPKISSIKTRNSTREKTMFFFFKKKIVETCDDVCCA